MRAWAALALMAAGALMHAASWHRWSVGAAVLLVLGSPLVAAFTHAIGSFDANPWYEAIMGVFVGGAGLCLLVEAVLRSARPARVAVSSAAV